GLSGDLEQHLRQGVALEGHGATQSLEEDNPERIDVSKVSDFLFTQYLLRRHVVGRAHQFAGFCCAAAPVVNLRDPKIENLDEVCVSEAVNEKDILWFEVAMHDAFRRGGAQGGTN